MVDSRQDMLLESQIELAISKGLFAILFSVGAVHVLNCRQQSNADVGTEAKKPNAKSPDAMRIWKRTFAARNRRFSTLLN